MTPDIPAEYTAILMGAVTVYGALSFLLIQGLRRVFPIEGATARIAAMVIAAALGLLAAAQHLLPLWPSIPQEQRALTIVGMIGAVWWVSQEIYRRLRADTWKTKAAPWPNE